MIEIGFGRRAVAPEEKKRLVRDLFEPIAATYDRADTILSAGLDARWRRKAIALLGLRAGQRVLDVCGGTAGLAVLAARDTAPGGFALVYDFSEAMMTVGRARIRRGRRRARVLFVRGDAEALGFPSGAFDAVTIGFGLRNLALPERGLREMHRVLRARRDADGPRVLPAPPRPRPPSLSFLFVQGHALPGGPHLRGLRPVPVPGRVDQPVPSARGGRRDDRPCRILRSLVPPSYGRDRRDLPGAETRKPGAAPPRPARRPHETEDRSRDREHGRPLSPLRHVQDRLPGHRIVRVRAPKRSIVAYYPQGRMDLCHALAEGRISLTPALVDVARDCDLCGACDLQCHFVTGLRPLAVMKALKEHVEELVASGVPVEAVPPRTSR